MTSPRVPYSMPSIEEADIEALARVLRGGWLAFGEEKERFEAAFAARIGVPHAVTANSCTSALEIALAAAGVQGQVIVPSFTWVATANAVVNAGATPVFCDVDLETGNATADKIEAVVSPSTEAVIVVHYAGQPCAMDPIVDLCARRSLLLIEDLAETLGATWNGRVAGSFGIGCFSFYPTKAITTGEGGMLTTRDRAVAEKARSLISHGLTSSPPLDRGAHSPWERAALVAGHNYRMPNLLAALGLSQLARLDALNARRVALADRYNRSLAGLALASILRPSCRAHRTFTRCTSCEWSRAETPCSADCGLTASRRTSISNRPPIASPSISREVRCRCPLPSDCRPRCCRCPSTPT